MKNLNDVGVENIPYSDSLQITGGGFWGDVGYAAGYVAGTVIRANVAFYAGVMDVLESGGEQVHRNYVN